MKPEKQIHGFKFTSSRELPEIGGTLHEAVYEKNGAKLIYIERDDSNKTFAIAFKTIPEDDTGVFHILEHSVLCGSEKYPVKEPFVELLKGSVKTFLNAFTFPDKTMYPVSSRNDKDFLNLVDIYMDAVLHPMAVSKPEIFYQEGWHHELHGKSEDMIYKGVVFNEMKGAYSSADELEMEEMSTLIYRGSTYGRDSGGDPVAIPNLTYEQFTAAHARYYHPSNSRIILDGAVDLDKVLSLLDSFLSEYDALEVDSDIPMVEPSGHVESTVEYEIAPGENPDGKCRVCLGFMVGDYTERRKSTALSIITDAIAGSNDAPFKRAMLDSGLCEDAGFIAYDGIQQNSSLIEIKNVKHENMEAAKALAFDTLRTIAKNGIDREALTASFNRFEFRMREQDGAGFPMGIGYAISALDTWLYGGDPIEGLSFEADIKYLREKLATDYYEKLIEEVFLSSKHSATLYMLPSETLGERKLAAERERLASAKAAMSEQELNCVIARTEKIENWQKTPDTQEALATLPKLTLSDISPVPEKYPSTEYKIGDVPALFTQSSSRGITYANLLFDISDFNEDELFLASLLAELYKNVGTDKRSAVELQNEIKSELGAFGTSTLVAKKGGVVTPYFQIAISVLGTKRPSAVKLTEEIALHSRFTDSTAIGKIVKQIRVGDAEAIAAGGHTVAFMRALSYLSAEAAVSEYLNGVENYLRMKSLDKSYDEKSGELLPMLEETSKRIFTKKRLTVCHSGERCDEFMKDIISVFPEGEDFSRGSEIKPLGDRCEGILIPASISFASKAANVYEYEDRVHGALGVSRTILSFGYLWNAIRVQGGAYGAGFIKRNNGDIGYYTYRDPDARRSLSCFDESPAFLRSLAASGESLESFIIGAIGDSDPLVTPKLLNGLALSSYINGYTYEERERQRAEMLSTTPDDLLKVADLIEKAMANAGFCVVGGKDKLDALGEKVTSVIEI